jgi:adenylate cyclase
MLAGSYLVIVRYFGLGPFEPPDINYVELVGYAGIGGFVIGLIFGLFPLGALLRFKNRTSFLSAVFVGTFCYILFFIAVIFVSSALGNSMEFAAWYVFSPDALVVLFHLSLSSAFYHFILQINRKFGRGVFLEYLLGKYFVPKQEERAFMFLDLKSSTRLAEILEHVSYSRLVQDCYAELTAPVIDNKAQIYQYVGDEVVVSWKIDQNFNASYCTEFFFDFMDRLEAKRNYFVQHYAVYPQFKAGVHCGKVTVAEVGEIKTEIAYHGDVVNTASRIQNLCNRYDKLLLMSESVLRHLPEKIRVHASFVAEAEIKGKKTTTRVFTISGLDNLSVKS